MARPKTKRDYDNPVWVELEFKNGTAEKAEVNEYRVTETHVILTVVGSARRTRYVALSELADFEFNEPKDRVQPSQVGYPQHQPLFTVPTGPVSMSPGRDALVAQIQADAARTPRAARKPNPDEKSVVEAAASGVPAAGMN